MRGLSRSAAQVTGAIAIGAVLVVVAGALLAPRGDDPADSRVAARAHSTRDAGPGQDLTGAIQRAQVRLRRLPADWPTWAELGLAYVQQARITADPAYYSRAEGALQRSLKVKPQENALALAGLGALAAARHDFADALRYGKQATGTDPYLAAAHGVVADALIELGRYPEAYQAIQKMVDLRPDTASYTRASYAWELRGNLPRARDALQDALDAAPTAADAGYSLFYLAELAFNAGDLKTATTHYTEGLRRAPGYLPLRAGRAKLRAAQGHKAEAVAEYRAVVARLPQPGYVTELGDLLAVTGDRPGGDQQYALVRAEQQLLARSGVDVDLELALFAADHGAPGEALAVAQKAYKKRPNIFAADALAWALHKNGKHTEALRYARDAVKLGIRSAALRYHLGMIEVAAGQRDAGRRDLTLALKINPHFSTVHAPAARSTLASLGGGK